MRTRYLIFGLIGAALSAHGQTREAIRGQVLDQFEPVRFHDLGTIGAKGGGFFWEEDFSGAQNGAGGVTTANGQWAVSGPNGAVWKHG